MYIPPFLGTSSSLEAVRQRSLTLEKALGNGTVLIGSCRHGPRRAVQARRQAVGGAGFGTDPTKARPARARHRHRHCRPRRRSGRGVEPAGSEGGSRAVQKSGVRLGCSPPVNFTCPGDMLYSCCIGCPKICGEDVPHVCLAVCLTGCICPCGKEWTDKDGGGCYAEASQFPRLVIG
jgi:hypothetical protein